MLGITTYLSEYNKDKRLNTIKKSFSSLIDKLGRENIVVVDDGSKIRDHIDFIKGLGLLVIEKQENRGYAKAKNTLIKYMMDKGCEFGMLADDDNFYHEGFYEQYKEAAEKTGISHFNLRLGISTLGKLKPKEQDLEERNGVKIRRTPLVNGCLWTITRKMVEKIGYMNELPNKVGHEHGIYTQRAIHNGFAPGYFDVQDPKVDNLQVIDEENYSVSVEDAYDLDKLNENGKYFNKDYEKFIPFHD